MKTSRSRTRGLAAAVIAVGLLAAGCSSSSHASSSTTVPPTTIAIVTPKRPASSHPAPTGAGSPVSAVSRADLASLRQELDAAGSSLGAASSALAQSDPNQTKNSEGSLP